MTHPRWPPAATGIALLLTLPSIWAGLAIDDYFIRMVVRQPESAPMELPSRLDTFSFVRTPEFTIRGIEDGTLPWWTSPELKGRFWRLLTSVTHFIDYQLWPAHVWLMHVHSLLWYGASVLVVALVFRRLMGPTIAAGLAALLFAVEECHCIPVGWLANRSSLLACFFGMSALLCHHAWREKNSRAKAVAALALFIAALFSAEAGIAAMAYITAYALTLDRTPWRSRLLSLTPYAAAIAIWRILWSRLGYGIHGMPLYVDPPRQPLEFIRALFVRIPQIITAQLVLPPAEIQAGAFVPFPWTWLFSALITVIVVSLFWPLIRHQPVARFLALGTAFAIVPACATIPQGRCLVFVGIGAFGLLAMWLTELPQKTAWPRATIAAAAFFVILHLVVAPPVLALLSVLPVRYVDRTQRDVELPDLPDIENCDLIVVNHPLPVLFYDLAGKAMSGRPLPAHTRVLCQAFTPIAIRRTSPNQLHLSADHGIPDVPSRLVFHWGDGLRPGAKIRMAGLTIEVLTVDKRGVPLSANFTFDSDLEDACLKWLIWKPGGFKRWTPPEMGQTAKIPFVAPPIFKWIQSHTTTACTAPK